MKRTLPFIAALICCLSTSYHGYSQLSEGGQPLSLSLSGNAQNLINQQLSDIKIIRSPKTDSLLAAAKQDIGGPYLFAIDQLLNVDIKSKKYIPVDGGGKLWVWRFSFPAALSLNAYFSTFKLGRGAKLFVYSSDRSQILGAFSAINNQSHGKLSTGLIRGGEVVVEYYESAETKESEVVLGTVAYGFRDPFGELQSNNPLQVNESSTCNVNVNCSTNGSVQTVKRAVAKILYQKSGLWYICSGSLMNNTDMDGKPYFLTAFHCYNGSDVNSYIFYFNYESPDCNNPSSTPSSNSLSGATFKSAWSGSDFALVQINDYPPISYNVYYAGFDATDTAPPSTIGIHHPKGDIKKLSIDNQTPVKSSVTISGQTSAVWNTRFDSGTTEGGSSGSPLFSSDYRVIAQLYGVGWSYAGDYNPCALQSNTQYYGRLGVSWNGGGTASTRLKDWLAPNQNTTSLNGISCPTNSPVCNFCSVGLYSIGCSDQDGLNALSVNNTVLTSFSGCSSNAYNYYGATVPTLNLGKGTSNPFTAELISTTYNEMVAIWIDFNKDKQYTADEKVFQTSAPVTGSFTGNIVIPCTTAVGATRMRVRVIYTTSTQDVDPCNTYTYGEVEEYDVNIGSFPAPVVSAAPSGPVCAGSTVTLSASNCAGTVSWGSAGTGSSITVTPTTTTTYTATCTNGGCSSSANISVTINAAPTITANTANLCEGQNITFTASNVAPNTLLQWQRNGVNIGGATGTTYTANTAGNYTVTNLQTTANGAWSWQNPLPLGNSLTEVHFIDAQTGWALSSGALLKTTNGGTSWSVIPINTSELLRDVFFSDAQTGWISGNNGTILKTTNGGTTWTAQNSGTTTALNEIYFTDAQTGWIGGNGGLILKTTNGGVSWAAVSTAASDIFGIHFVSSQVGWAVSFYGTILKTTDGGNNWTNQYTDSNINALHSVWFIDAQTGWAAGSTGSVLKTTNGGTNWTVQTTNTTDGIDKVQFADAQNGWAAAGFGKILKTANGGTSWTSVTIPATDAPIYDLYFISAQTGWVVGQYGKIVKTTDGGTTWSEQSTSVSSKYLTGVYFTDNQTGWAIGSGTILKTANGGSNWSVQKSEPSGYDLRGVYFTNSQTGWAVGEAGRTYRTTDGGTTWLSKVASFATYLYGVHFVDSQIGWIVGDNGVIGKTTDGGVNWASQSSGTVNNLSDVFFSDAQTGWAVGANGTLLKTTNGGTFWAAQASGTTHFLTDISFFGSQTGWIVGGTYNSNTNTPTLTLLKTTNGGSSWTVHYQSNNFWSGASVHFADTQNGWITCNDQKVLRTTDGGSTWTVTNINTIGIQVSKVFFADAYNGWVVGGGNAAIVKYSASTPLCTSNTLTINAFPPPVVSALPSGGVCAGSPATLTATNCSGTVSWGSAGNGNTVTVTPTVTTTYTATCSSNGCSSNASVTVTVNPVPIITANTANLCEGQSVTFTASNVPAGTSLQWYNNGTPISGATGTIYTGSAAGSYTTATTQSLGTAASWTSQTTSTVQGLTGVFFVSSQVGWSVGNGGTILRTADSGGTWIVQTSGTAENLKSIYFLNSQIGWTVGSSGIILKTVNGGSTWAAQTSGTTNDLNSIHFIDSQTGWAVGAGGIILKTANGGSTWSVQTSGTSSILNSLFFANSQTGWIVGNDGVVLKTVNAGSTWSAQIWSTQSGYSTNLTSVHFIDTQTGIAVAGFGGFYGGTIIRTTDGGTNWSVSSGLNNYALEGCRFSDAQTAWVFGSSGRILKSVNSGNWVEQNSINGGGPWIKAIYFSDAQNGWAVGSGNGNNAKDAILKYGIFTSPACTSNSISINATPVITANPTTLCEGQNVTLTASNVPPNTPLQWQRNGVDIQGATGVTYSANTTGNYAVKAAHINGIWSSQTSGTLQSLSGIYAVNNQNVWVVGAGGTILKTTDGGAVWSAQTSGVSVALNAVRFVNAQTGWAVGQSGTIRKTTDGGNSWSAQTSGTTAELKSVYFTDAQTGWAAGSSGTLLKTTNGGTTWTVQTFASADFESIHFSDALNGRTVGRTSGSNLKTTDGGTAWTAFSSVINAYYPTDIFFINTQTGWIAGGGISKTIDGGANWSTQVSPSGAQYELASKYLYFVDSQKGWAVGSTNTIFQTINGGTNWTTQPVGVSLRDVMFTDAQNGWAVGSNGTILKYNAPVCASSTITVSSCIPLTIAPSKVFICPNTSTTLTVSGCSGTVTWTGGNTGSSLVIAPATTSTYTATCSTGGSASITVNVAAATATLSTTDNISSGTQVIQVTQSIAAANSIGSSAVNPKPTVGYQAGKSVLLQPGFSVVGGSTFKAEIKGCTN